MEAASFLLFPFSLSALSLHAVNYLNTAYLTITLAIPFETIHALQRRFISSNMRWNAFIVFNCIARVLVINSNLQLFVFLQSKKKYTIVVKSKHLFLIGRHWDTLLLHARIWKRRLYLTSTVRDIQRRQPIIYQLNDSYGCMIPYVFFDMLSHSLLMIVIFRKRHKKRESCITW